MCSVMLDAVSNATKEQSMVQAGGIAGRQRHRQRQHAGAPAYSSATHGWGSAVGQPRGRGRARLPLGATKRRLVCVHGYHMHAIVMLSRFDTDDQIRHEIGQSRFHRSLKAHYCSIQHPILPHVLYRTQVQKRPTLLYYGTCTPGYQTQIGVAVKIPQASQHLCRTYF